MACPRRCHRVFDAPVFDVAGGPVPEEREVPGVAGWADSRPVRVGNAARNQIQYDALGFVVEAISTHLQHCQRLASRPSPAGPGVVPGRQASAMTTAASRTAQATPVASTGSPRPVLARMAMAVTGTA